MQFKPGDMVFLRLHQGYTVPSIRSKKLAIQRCGPFKVVKKVGNLAYRLELPEDMKIHPVISVAQLEPAPVGPDPYDRPKPDHPPSVETGSSDDWESWEIESLLDRRTKRLAHGKTKTEYLVRWKGYGPEYDKWYKKELLDGATELVREYDRKFGRRGSHL
jgi:hypothetical protein